MSDSRKRIFRDDLPKTPYKKPKSNHLKDLKGYNLHDIEDIYQEDEYETEEE